KERDLGSYVKRGTLNEGGENAFWRQRLSLHIHIAKITHPYRLQLKLSVWDESSDRGQPKLLRSKYACSAHCAFAVNQVPTGLPSPQRSNIPLELKSLADSQRRESRLCPRVLHPVQSSETVLPHFPASFQPSLRPLS